MFPPIFPVYIPALVPLHQYAPLIWMSGVVCLWLTRYTHQLEKRLGSAYYMLSALIRPTGILLISMGWLALFAPNPGYPVPGGISRGWLPRGNWTDVLCWLAIAVLFAFGVWAIATLGLRRSFLFRHVDDGLITSGPYAIVRHPQFLSAIGVSFFVVRLFDPTDFPSVAFGAYYHSLDLNWALFTLSFWVLSILEERELKAHFGDEYEEYSRRVPRLFPN